GFPYGTLTVNVLGSFLMGALIEVMALRWSVGPEVRALLSVGVLGGFTTFSTFSLDFVVLVERGQLGTALGYAALSFSLSILGLFAGLWLFRTILA
ncbi:MAG TPA: CrcB family protein, partial [Alphaproteobacteria bacterium]|nr:CrcB family protein [Alphaproteobacteria bacterium]